ncbi:MAG: hypothetical protein M1816_006857 [Peltula sp. TS41687]|nr:MAG: hypothetical protein M1816_006857 [Peltula sp. TS41687]
MPSVPRRPVRKPTFFLYPGDCTKFYACIPDAVNRIPGRRPPIEVHQCPDDDDCAQ